MPQRAWALTQASLVPVSLAIFTSIMPSAAWADSADELITKFCMASFNAAMTSAGKTPPAGMGQFTCQCFLDQVKDGDSIESAQNSCKARAASRYKL